MSLIISSNIDLVGSGSGVSKLWSIGLLNVMSACQVSSKNKFHILQLSNYLSSSGIDISMLVLIMTPLSFASYSDAKTKSHFLFLKQYSECPLYIENCNPFGSKFWPMLDVLHFYKNCMHNLRRITKQVNLLIFPNCNRLFPFFCGLSHPIFIILLIPITFAV